MPNLLVKIPHGTYPGAARATLLRCLTTAAAEVEQIPDDPAMRFLCWVVIDEIVSAHWTCGGIDVSDRILPCIAVVCVPAGVIDAASRARYARRIHEAFLQALPAGEHRQLATSVILHDVADATWGANGTLMTLPLFAASAGYTHLQHACIDSHVSSAGETRR